MSDQIFDQLRDLIFRGQLKPGDRVMSEREMAETFGVSRPTVREAIHKLVDRGLLEHRHGVGTFVLERGRKTDAHPLLQVLGGHEPTLEELLEVRMALECNSAVLAAQRASEADLNLLEKNVAEMGREVETGQIVLDEDASFHMNIAFATNNVVQIHLMRSFYELLHYGMNRMFHDWYATPGNDRLAYQHHLRIFEAIRRRDGQAAGQAMEEHIGSLLSFCRERWL